MYEFLSRAGDADASYPKMRVVGFFHARRIGMLWRIAKLYVLLAVSAGTVAGCSKEKPQKIASPPPVSATPAPEAGRDGEELFKQYCAACHPNGGNVSDPERTLHGSVLKKKQINTPEDIVRIMRKPLSRMIRFDAATLSDKDARTIADYVLRTFK
jgi:cytochrome c6